MKLYSNFCKTQDNEQVFYATNFPHHEEVENLIVLNYGLVCNNDHWKMQTNHFEKKGYKFLIHDYRGHYQSSGKENLKEITFNNMAKDLHQILSEIRANNIIMLGHSMGVNVTLEYCHLFPNTVSKIVLISGTIFPVQNVLMNTHLFSSLRPLFTKLLKSHPAFLEKFWKYGGWNAFVKTILHVGGFNYKQVDSKFIEVYMNKLGELGPHIFFQLIDEMQRHDALSFVEEIQTKTLVVGGNKDKVIPNYLQRLLQQKIPNSELYIIHDGSHVPQVDFPEIINERLDLFFEFQ